MSKKYTWENFSDAQILELKFKDLKLTLKGSWLEPHIQKLYRELEKKRLKFKPHIWISDEWFSPDGVPGFAIPFYLVHPRLIKLQKNKFLEAEGSSEKQLMKLLRHETGHAIDNAFHLRKSKERQQLFGLSSTPYPEAYSPKAYSKKYVINLNSWYAQSHPDEDWAETFAVWLNPKSNWKVRYDHWPALEKLILLDSIMKKIKNKRPLIAKKNKPDLLSKSSKKISSYYDTKQDELGLDQPYFLDPIILRLFSSDPKYKKNGTAAKFIRKERSNISKPVAKWTGQYNYTINLIVEEIIQSCEEKKLYLTQKHQPTLMDLVGMLTAQTLNYISSGNHTIPM